MATWAPPFRFEIEEISPTDPLTYDQTGHWFPPDLIAGQTKIPCQRTIYRWNAGAVQSVALPTASEIYKQVTMYHCLGRFWVVPYDATQWNVRSAPPNSPWYPGWKGLNFEHLPNGVSSVGYAHGEETLATQRPNQMWCRQLFPDGYLAGQETGQAGGLQGDLAIILALGGFSAPPGRMADAIAASFKVGRWQQHFLNPSGVRENRRGFIVTVYVDPESSKQQLRSFEDGLYGPIFA